MATNHFRISDLARAVGFTEAPSVADWIIDLGPEGDVAGSQLIAQGRSKDVAKLSV